MGRELKYEDVEIGTEYGPIQYEVTREVITSFANSVDNRDEWYLVNSPFGGRIAPPEFNARDYPVLMTADKGRSMFKGVVGKFEIETIKPVLEGTKVTVTGKITDKYERRGRKYVVFEDWCMDEDNQVLVRHKVTMVAEM